MPFPIHKSITIPELFDNSPFEVNLFGGLTIFLGPNGSGKTQVLRKLKTELSANLNGRHCRYLSAGRLSPLENYRSDYDGHRGNPNYDQATFGGVHFRNTRHKSETAFGDFHTLSVRPDLQIKVSERLRSLFKREVFLEWDAGDLKVKFKRTDSSSNPYSSAREASGLLQLVVILAAIFDDDVGALLLDEPEISLHPQLQSFLLNEFKKVSGDPSIPGKKIIIIGTHSTEFIELRKPVDISKILFFKDSSTAPSQINPTASVLRNSKLKSFISRIGHSQKEALFASRPLLVEGPSDVIIANALEAKFDIYLGAAGSQALSVIGKGQMPIVLKFFRLIGKDPVMLTDLDAIADNQELVNALPTNTQVNRVASGQGHTSLKTMARNIFNDFCQQVENSWPEISVLAEQHSYFSGSGEEQLRRRRSAMAVVLTTPNEDLETINESWISIKLRLISLIDLLKKMGCFILMNGTIEDYYMLQNTEGVQSKIELAVKEFDEIVSGNKRNISRIYKDVIEALQFASRAPKINEAKALSDILLAVASPAVSRLGSNPQQSELESLAYSLIGEKSSLFEIAIISENGETAIRIDNKSSILDVDGFPIIFAKGTNVVNEVLENIKPKE